MRTVRAASDDPHRDLVEHLARSTPLAPAQVARVVAEVVDYFGETAEAYVRRRHRELKSEGLTNDAIFARVGDELRERRVRVPELSARQLRRMVYG
jgi:hypothetical protein